MCFLKKTDNAPFYLIFPFVHIYLIKVYWSSAISPLIRYYYVVLFYLMQNNKLKQCDVGFIYGHQSNCSPNINIGHWKRHNNQPLKMFLSGTSSVFIALLWTGLWEIENIILEKSVRTLALSKCFARVPGCMNRWINVNYSDTSTFEFRCLTWPAAFGFIQKCLAKIQRLTSSCYSNV